MAEKAVVSFYEKGDGGQLLCKAYLKEAEEGLWPSKVNKELHEYYYIYQVKVKGIWLDETPGIYAPLSEVNSRRAMVIDWAATDPAGWKIDKGSAFLLPE